MTFASFIDLIKSDDFVVLDTETSGLDSTAEIVQIAIIDSQGNVLLDTLVKPTRPIPTDASRIHGIFDENVKDALAWKDTLSHVEYLIKDRDVVIYNADFDIRLMRQSAKAVDIEWARGLGFWHCAMLAYAEYYGDWNDYRQSYHWQRLSDACEQQSIPVINAHNALADCQMTLALVKKMAEKSQDKEKE